MNTNQLVRRPYSEWVRDDIAKVIRKNFYLSGADEFRIADEVMKNLHRFGKLKNTTYDLMTYNEFVNYDENKTLKIKG